MLRLLFEKTGNAVWISHLDLMRLFQRAFQRAGLPLTHTHGFHPRPSVSIALPLSVGAESRCELLDFDLEGISLPPEEIRDRLNAALIRGVRVREVYDGGRAVKHLHLLSCEIDLEDDAGIPESAQPQIEELFRRPEVIMEKKTKHGPEQQDIIPMIRRISVKESDGNTLTLEVLITCREPSLNPSQISGAVSLYLPECAPDFSKYRRIEIYDENETIFR